MNFNKAEHPYWSVNRQEVISCLCCVLMIVGLLFSRALLSAGMVVFFLNALHPQKLKANWQAFKQNKFAIFCVVFFAVYALSGLWSDDKMGWVSAIQIKLPFIFLPFAMVDLPVKREGFVKIIVGSFLLCLLAGMLYGFAFLRSPWHRSGDHLPSPLEGDYIRFTLSIVLALLLAIYLYRHRLQFSITKMQLSVLLLWSIVAILYIHVQAAKSGLVSFYILAGMFIFHSFVRKKQAIWVVCGMLVAVIAGGFILSKLPSVQKQIRDFKHEKKIWETKDSMAFNSAYSFVPRLISYEVAGTIIKEHPIAGVGAGDLMPEIEHLYELNYPTVRKQGRILPHNQFICTALAAGIPLAVFLLLLVFAPLMGKRNRNIYSAVTVVIMIFGMLIEPMLEVQFGVFVYLFFTLLFIRLPTDSDSGATGI